jgi:Leucine-rich repeat (LRR) protein
MPRKPSSKAPKEPKAEAASKSTQPATKSKPKKAKLPSELVEALHAPDKATRLWLRGWEIPPEVEQLPHLTYLSAGEFGKPISIAPQLAALTELETLQLNGDLEQLPPILGMKKLRSLRLVLTRPEIGEAVAQLGQLEELDLRVGSWGEGPKVPFPLWVTRLKQLKQLKLAGPVDSVPDALAELSKLEQVEFDSLEPMPLLPKALARLPKLRELKIKVTQLDAQLGELTSLEKLIARDNKALTHLPPELGRLKKLVELDVGYDGLVELPVEIGELTELKRLCAYGNQLTAVPKELGRLEKLKELELNMNPLGSLPAEIGGLKSLESLKLGEDAERPSGVESWPPEIGQLTKLKTIWSPSGKLKTIPPELGDCMALETLYLPGNQLDSVPATLGQLKKLRWLSLGANSLSSLPDEINGCTALKELDLTGCSFPQAELDKVIAFKKQQGDSYEFKLPRLAKARPAPPKDASPARLSAAVLEQLTRLGAKLESPAEIPPREKVKTKGGTWPLPEAMRQLIYDVRWPEGIVYEVTVGVWEFHGIDFQIGSNLEEYECTFHRPFYGGTTDRNGNAIVWNLADSDPTDPELFRVDHEGWSEHDALRLGIRLSKFLSKLKGSPSTRRLRKAETD